MSMINRLRQFVAPRYVLATSLRRIRTACVVACGLLVLGACSQAKQPDNSPAGIVSQFYTWRIQSHMMGAPTADQLEGMRPLISSELQTLLQRTSEKAAAKAKSKVGRKRKPVFTDGDLFSSIAVGPTSFKTGEVEVLDNDTHVIPVRFMSARQLPAINWTDRVKVVNENGHYVLADIEYANHWQAGGNGTLVKSLRKTAKS
jgi:hypothetical protein